MKKSKYTEEQIAFALKQTELAAPKSNVIVIFLSTLICTHTRVIARLYHFVRVYSKRHTK